MTAEQVQPKAKVKVSVGTKLLVSLVLMLGAAIFVLNVSTVYLLKEDKRAYVYQTQSTAAVLLGRELVTLLRHGLDTTRVSLGMVDPYKQPGPQELAALKTMIQNQTEVLALRLLLLDPAGQNPKPVADAAKDETAPKPPDTGWVTPEWWKAVLPELTQSGYAFLNLSSAGGPPLIGVATADLKNKDNPAGMPIALGVLGLRDLSSELHGLDLTVATQTGWVLFDTNAERLFGRVNVADDPIFERAARSKAVSGAAEYDVAGDRILGSYSNPGLNIAVLARSEWKKAVQATYALTEKCILIGGMVIGAAIIFAIFFSRSLTAPLQKLYRATFDIAEGNFDLALKAESHDEIGVLTDSFNAMSQHISELIVERMHKVQIENELAVAQTVQRTLIPPETFVDRNIAIHSHYRSASICGGDWWGFFTVGNRACFMIADATGHGVPSALITASARSCFSVMHKLSEEHGALTVTPLTMLRYANRVIYEASNASIMMTMFVAVVDFETKTLTYANAGHNPPWLFRFENGAYKLVSLMGKGTRLGESSDNMDFEEKTVPISAQDTLFLYTDGLMEGKSESGEMFGKKRTRVLVEKNVSAGPKPVIDALMESFLVHNGGKPLDDDITLAVAKFFP
jgi:serine phosphatase RsbU (regulator of sigma subunit)